MESRDPPWCVIMWSFGWLPPVIKCDHFVYSPRLDHEILEQPLNLQWLPKICRWVRMVQLIAQFYTSVTAIFYLINIALHVHFNLWDPFLLYIPLSIRTSVSGRGGVGSAEISVKKMNQFKIISNTQVWENSAKIKVTEVGQSIDEKKSPSWDTGSCGG